MARSRRRSAAAAEFYGPLMISRGTKSRIECAASGGFHAERSRWWKRSSDRASERLCLFSWLSVLRASISELRIADGSDPKKPFVPARSRTDRPRMSWLTDSPMESRPAVLSIYAIGDALSDKTPRTLTYPMKGFYSAVSGFRLKSSNSIANFILCFIYENPRLAFHQAAQTKGLGLDRSTCGSSSTMTTNTNVIDFGCMPILIRAFGFGHVRVTYPRMYFSYYAITQIGCIDNIY